MALRDRDVRVSLLEKLGSMKAYAPGATTVVVPEMDICGGCARVDIAVVNHELSGYEIKSEKDTLQRLPSQADLYSRVFDRATLVVAESHYSEAMTLIPDWWGIISCVARINDLTLCEARKARRNRSVSPLALGRILWKSEQMQLLKGIGLSRGLKSKSRYERAQCIAKNIELRQIKRFVRQALKARRDWRAVPLRQLCDAPR